jgi:MFS family permease
VLDRTAKVDWLGFSAFVGFLLCLMIALTIAAYGIGQTNTVYVLFGLSAIFLIGFVAIERRVKYPLVDLQLFRIRQVTGGVVAMLFNIMTWTAVLLLLSLQFQLVLNESPLEAGLRILPFEIAFLAVGPLSGRLADKFRPVPFIVGGLSLSTVALLLFSTTSQNTDYTTLSFYMVLLGIGTGLFVAPNLRAVLGSVPAQRRGIGSALFSLFLNIGFTLSLNVAILVMSLTAPYNLITRILSEGNPAAIVLSERLVFAASLQNTYVVLALINAIAIAPSLLQITRRARPEKGKIEITMPEG